MTLADIYTREATAWLFLAGGIAVFLFAQGKAAARWAVSERKKWQRRRTRPPLDLSSYASKRHR